MATTPNAFAAATPSAAKAASPIISFLRNFPPPDFERSGSRGAYFLHFWLIGFLTTSPVRKWKSPSAFQEPLHFLGVTIRKIFFLPFLIVFLFVVVSTVPTEASGALGS